MQNKPLHIISFDNPFPPVYGGIIDVYYKIKSLHDLGFEIYLHCFVSKIPEDTLELNKIAKQVFIYKTSTSPVHFFSRIPYSVISRNNKLLIENINKIDAPILFESLKTTYLVHKKQLKNHFKILRLHNIEQDYFNGISKSETSILRKLLFFIEGLKYKKYEHIIDKFDKVITLSNFENEYVNKKYSNSVYVPVFHGNDSVAFLDGIGDYALYHGDLNTSDNRRVVRFLIEVFKEIKDYKLVIASSSKREKVINLIGDSKNIEFIQLKNQDHIQSLFNHSHINISWSFQKSGTKLKLINSLFNGRFALINHNIIDDKNISSLCFFASNKEELIVKVNELKNLVFNDFDVKNKILKLYYDDKNNAKLIENIFVNK